jgi:hypothetical protein
MYNSTSGLGFEKVELNTNEEGTISHYSPTLVVLKNKDIEESHLIYAAQWWIELVDSEGSSSTFNGEVVGARLTDPPKVTSAWYRGNKKQSVPIQPGQQFYNPLKERSVISHILTTNYQGPINGGSIFVKHFGIPEDFEISVVSEEWFEENDDELVPVERVQLSTEVIEGGAY